MNATPVTDTPGRRAGATWVAATGAFLLLAAAAVFVATRWDDIPEAVKLAVLAGLTGAVTVAGDRVRSALPATGNALFHLGALLIPVDGAALGVRIGLEWQELLLANGLLAAAVLALLARRSGSPVLAAAASAGVAAATGGAGALTGVPGPLVLAAVAAVAVWFAPTERHAWVWAQLAGLAPLLTLALHDVAYGRGVAEQLGVLSVRPWYTAAAAGVLAAAVIARSARRRREPALALVGLAALAGHAIAAWNATTVPHIVATLAFPALFLVVELGVLLAQRDSFWARPARGVAMAVEIVAAVATVIVVPISLAMTALDLETDATLALAAALTGFAWVVATARPTSRSRLTAGAATIWIVSAAAIATADPPIVASTALTIAVAAITLSKKATAASCGLALYATLAGIGDDGFALAISVAAALAVAFALVVTEATTDERALGVVTAIGVLSFGEAAGAASLGPVVSALLWILTCWIVASAGDEPGGRTGDLARAAAFLALAPMLGWSAADVLVPAAALAALAGCESLLTRRVELANAAVFPALFAQTALAALAGLGVGGTGLASCVAASVWLGFAALAQSPWHRPLSFAALGSATVGVVAAAAAPATLGPALLVVGMLAVGEGFLLAKPLLTHAGALVATVGAWITFAAHDVMAAEAYAAPVAVYLLAVGVVGRRDARHRMSSWVAYGPAVALLAGAAFAERLGGGDAWHSVFAGAVGVVAVVAGGSRRLGAPLLLGTATLVAVVGRESFDTAAGIPTWAWLATGGATLIASAVVMERRDVTPIEAGRRVVDVLAANFE